MSPDKRDVQGHAGRSDGRLDEELRFHVDQQTGQLVRQGMSPRAARREALLRLGAVESVKDEARDQMRWAWARGIGRDIRYGARALLRTPGASIAAVATLGLGLAASTALFSVVNGVLLRELPYPEADRIVRLYQMNADSPGGAARRTGNVAEPNVIDWRARTASFEAIALMNRLGTVPVASDRQAVLARAAGVSREFFEVLRVGPASGRLFTADELRPGGAPVVLVSAALRRRVFGDELPSEGTLRIGGSMFAVVGEMPEGFDFPGGTEVWTPSEQQPPSTSRTAHNHQAIGRLADGVSLAHARAELSAVSRAMKVEYGDETWMVDAAVVPLLEQTTAGVRPAIATLFAAAVVLFIIACTNVTNLLLARDAARAPQVALQLALGARRWRVVRQRLVEIFLLALAAAAVGLVAASAATRVLVRLDPGTVPRLGEVGLDWTALAFACAAAVAATLGIGLVAALRGADRNLREVLADAARSTTSGRGRERAREWLVVTQVALTLVLLSGTALLARSFAEVLSVDPGYRTEGVAVLNVAMAAPADPADAGRSQWAFQEELMGRIAALPGVTRVGLVSGLPTGGGGFYPDGQFLEMTRVDELTSMADVAALGERVRERAGSAGFRVVGGDYFAAMSIPVLAGRTFDSGDTPDAPHVAVVSDSLARARWPDRSPIGRFIQFGNMDGDPRGFRIVGVVGDVRELTPESDPGPLFYVDYRQRPAQASRVSVVASGAVSDVLAAAPRILRELNPALPIEMRTIEDTFDDALRGRRFNLLLIAAFGLAALALAVLGTYALVSYLVAQRTREIGIRLALGAEPSSVVRLITVRAVRLAALGVTAGLVVALLLTSLVRGMLFAVSPSDPVSLAAGALVLGGAVVVASFVPAWRAARISPVDTLRG